MLSDFYENDETTTINELVARMKQIISNPYHEATMKRKLENIDGIIISNNIVSTKSTADAVLKELRAKDILGLNDGDWKKHIIESAGEIIRGEIGEKKSKETPIQIYLILVI